jgi:hypothetical protein
VNALKPAIIRELADGQTVEEAIGDALIDEEPNAGTTLATDVSQNLVLFVQAETELSSGYFAKNISGSGPAAGRRDRTTKATSATTRKTLIKLSLSTGSKGKVHTSMKQRTLAMMTGFQRYSKKTRRATFLEEMEQVVPWVEQCALVELYYAIAGNGLQPGGIGADATGLFSPAMVQPVGPGGRGSTVRLGGDAAV